jgi:hypothetical protein
LAEGSSCICPLEDGAGYGRYGRGNGIRFKSMKIIACRLRRFRYDVLRNARETRGETRISVFNLRVTRHPRAIRKVNPSRLSAIEPVFAQSTERLCEKADRRPQSYLRAGVDPIVALRYE